VETGTRPLLILQGYNCRGTSSDVDGDNICYMSNTRYQNSGQNRGSDRRVTLEEYRPVFSLADLLRNDSSK